MSELVGEFDELKLGFALRKDDDSWPPEGSGQDFSEEITSPETMEGSPS